MNNTLISLESATAAMKAKKYLMSRGYKVSVEKSVDRGRSGCKSNIKVNGEMQTVCNELLKIGISCR